MPGRVEGKVAFITGAARGQGRSHAVRLAEEGADIIAVDICADVETIGYAMGTEEELAETGRLVQAMGRRIVTRTADVRDFGALEAAAADGVAELGRLDIVVANAGVASFAPSDQMSEETWTTLVDVNLTGVWHTYKATVPYVIASGGGSIMFISSTAGLKGIRNMAHYTSAKHGMVGLARTCASEVAEYGVRVNTIHPTNVDTYMIDNPQTRQALTSGQREVTRESMIGPATQMHLLPIPWIESRDVSHLVLFLGSDEARYITAASIPVDAGMTQK